MKKTLNRWEVAALIQDFVEDASKSDDTTQLERIAGFALTLAGHRKFEFKKETFENNWTFVELEDAK